MGILKRGGAGRSAPDEFVAGNGLLHRRALLGRGIALAGAAGTLGASMNGAAAEPLVDAEWSGHQGTTVEPFGRRSRFEKDTVRILSNPKGEARNYSPLLPDEKAYKFYFVNEVKSFITHPSFGTALKEPGYHEISGIAYSGSGRIERVMVSADGGKSWAEAAVEGPTTSKSFTRFHIPWRWDGSPAVLTSRAVDDGGNIQPLRADFVAVRGQTLKPITNTFGFANQHYNSLTSWGVDSKGEIKHVYV